MRKNHQHILKGVAITGLLFFSGELFSQTNLPCSAGSPTAPVLTPGAGCTWTTGNTTGLNWGTNAANGGTPTCATGTADGWYQFTAPASGSVTINTLAGTMTDGVMALYQGSCGAWVEIACNDNGAGMPSITATTLTPGAVYMIRIWQWSSGAGSFSICVQANPAAVNPCTSITNIGACGTAVTTTLSGNGSWNVTACGFTTSGTEMIYSFTPTTTGTYSLNVTSATGGFIDYFWMPASSGCASTGWTCIDDIIGPGVYGAMSWTAGVTYYILLDPEPTSSVTQTFTIPCPSSTNPCLGVTNIPSCGSSVNNTLTGTGAWLANPCGFTTSGQELVYSFTPTTSGVHSINVNAITGGFIDFAWSTTCASTGWTCIDDVISTGNYGAMNWTAGTTYYILVDAESTAGNTFGFSINCPGSSITASDCPNAVNVCTNINFSVDPNGFGTTNELTTCSVSNPCTNPASANSGCLNSGELNSTWMVVNIATSGTLEFSFGASGGPVVCYDWIMWPYSGTVCGSIVSNSVSPVRCNWNVPCAGYTGIATPVPAGGAAGNFEPELNVLAGQQYLICFSNYSSATTTVPLQFFGTAQVSCTPLAADLLEFNGEKQNADVKLNWAAATETAVKEYVVQHSLNAIDFSDIGKVHANDGMNIISEYDFTHSNPVEGENFYRIFQVDINNDVKISNTIKIDFIAGGLSLEQVFPNPSATGEFNVVINSSEEKQLNVIITDITGKEVKRIPLTVTKGVNTSVISCEMLARGIYTLKVADITGVQYGTSKLMRE